jgi:putative nucleotidyltransferase with HDIG domain
VTKPISKKQLERAIRELSPLSDAAQALVSLTNDDTHTAADIVGIVERDASLTIRVLRIANSPVIAPISPVESLQHAIALMGEDVVVTAALAVGANWMHDSLSGYGGEAKIFESGLKTAVSASLIAKRLKRDSLTSLAYTGGLLHDIGKVVLSEYLEPANAAAIVDASSGPTEDWLAAERAELGFDHCEVGAMVADHFGLGPALRSVIEHHHVPSEAPIEHRQLVEIVHVADGVRAMVGGDPSIDSFAYPLDRSVLASLGFGHEDLPEIICDTIEASRKLVDAISGA